MGEWIKVTWGEPSTYPPELVAIEMRRWMVDRWMATEGVTRRMNGDPLTTMIDGTNWWPEEDEALTPDVSEHGIVDTIYWRESTKE